MEIGIFCYNLSGTGPRNRARDIINALAERTSHTVVVLTNEPALVSEQAYVREISLQHPVRTCKTTNDAFSSVDVVQVPINIYQVLFVRLFYDGPLVAGVGPGIQPTRRHRLLGKFLGIDKKFIVHDQLTGWEEYGYDTEIVTATIDRERFYPYSEDKIAKVREELGFSEETDIVLYVGRLSEDNGAHLVDKMASLSDEEDEICFVVVGVGPLEDRFEGRSDLRYEGFVANDEMPKYYNAADVTVGPRKRDNTSNVGLESIACGTPYVTTAEAYIRDLFGETYVWAERTSESILETVQHLLSDEDFYEAQVERGLDTMEERPLTLDSALQIHLSVYEELIEEDSVEQ